MQKLLYKLGDYDLEIIKAGKLGIKFLLPGLSLLIVFITSSWGGYHLADVILGKWYYNILFTIGFITLILLVDFLLLHSEKKGWTAFLRILLAVSMGTLISVLTSLSIYEGDVKAKLATNVQTEIDFKMNIYDRDIHYIDSLVKILPGAIKDNKQNAIREQYSGNINEKRPPGKGPAYEYFLSQAKNDSISLKTNLQKLDSLKNNRSAFEKATRIEIEAKHSKDLNGQIENLWALMMDKNVSFFGVIIIFIALMVIDLMPISIKFGVKDSLDAKYEEFLKTLRTATDGDGNHRFYDVELEKFFMKNVKAKAKIEEEKYNETEKLTRIKANITKLEEVKKEYADKKLQYVIDKIKKWHTENDTKKSEKAESNNQNENPIQ